MISTKPQEAYLFNLEECSLNVNSKRQSNGEERIKRIIIGVTMISSQITLFKTSK